MSKKYTMVGRIFNIKPGRRFPLGAKADRNGVNFSIFSRHATDVELLLYEYFDSKQPFQVIRLEPQINKTFFSWHVYVEDLPPGTYYSWRVDGPNDTQHSGFRFNRNKELLDPWARAVTHDHWNRELAKSNRDDSRSTMRGIVVADGYDWEGDRPLNHSLENTIIYELHVGGFTRHGSSQVVHPGTFSGIVEKIPYLKALGITDVELMPVMAFDEQDVPVGAAKRSLRNYWGYSTHSFYSPHPGYCVTPNEGTHRREFRDMVKALHRAGIGVILDVVFNHTAEAGMDGPSINFKGIGNEMFYHLDPEDRRVYLDFTGCGNTVNCNHPLVARFLIDCLEYWVREMHVDGFRFDLASVLARGEDGEPMYHAPVLWNIEFSETLANTKIIAEAWDAGGLYQVGGFPGFRWAEWNGQYRDVVRRFVRGERGLVGEIATRISGSSDLYEAAGRLPINSINFITCHDGFTLYDLVSYNAKHNEVNGEKNHDGHDQNLSWNCGVEGETSDPEIYALRQRQAKNFLAILLLSHGVPMMLAGDEVLRTQRGNNNCYCQDNELSWFDWNLLYKNKGILRFCQQMIRFRKRHPSLRRKRFLTGQAHGGSAVADVVWHGEKLNEPLWHDLHGQLLAYTLSAVEEKEEALHIIFNMSASSMEVEVPQLEGHQWYRAVDTAFAAPEDILPREKQSDVVEVIYSAKPRSVVVLEGRMMFL